LHQSYRFSHPADQPSMSRTRTAAVLAASLFATISSVGSVLAQDSDPLRLPASVLTQVVMLPAGPGITTPTAFGTDFGQAFIGAGLQARTRYTDDPDGAFVVGVGLGDRRVLGVELAATSYSTFSERGGTFGEVGSLSVRVHRLVGRDFAIAAGWENPVHWGDSDAGESHYAVATRVFRNGVDGHQPFSATVISVGVGDGRFRTEHQVEEDLDKVNFFMSTGVRLHPNASWIIDWTGQDLNMAVSLMPLGRRFPIILTPGVADVWGNAGDGGRAILAVGYNFEFGNPFSRRN
jgi:hypothetical protein